MMIKILSRIKLAILCVIISALFLKCQKDDNLLTESESKTIDIKVKTLYNPNFSQNQKLDSKLSLFYNNTKVNNNSNNQAREIYIGQYDFTIDNQTVKHISYGQYESYTFSIYRTEDNELIENLVLSLQKDGNYKAFMVTYDLTENEIQLLEDNQYVDFTGKTSYTSIDSGVILDQNLFARTGCQEEEYPVWISCSENYHNESNVELWHLCVADKKPTMFIAVKTVCDNTSGGTGSDGTYDPNLIIPGGGSNGNGTGNNTGTGDPNQADPDNNDQEEPIDCLQLDIYGNCVGDLTIPIIKDKVDEDDLQIINELEDKALCVYIELKSSSTGFKNSIKKFDGEFTIADIKFKLDDTGSSVAVYDEFDNIIGYDRAHTSFPDANNLITISLNNVQSSNNNVDTQPNLLLAQTIAHEVIHAEMFRQILDAVEDGSIIGLTVQDVIDALANSEYTELYEYFRQTQNWSHTYMSEHYRETIARITQEFDTGLPVPENQQPQQLYLDIAWRGLMDNTAWDNEGQNQIAIESTINNYVTNNSNETCID